MLTGLKHTPQRKKKLISCEYNFLHMILPRSIFQAILCPLWSYFLSKNVGLPLFTAYCVIVELEGAVHNGIRYYLEKKLNANLFVSSI